MWAIGFYTPVRLEAVIDTQELVETGIELDSHITLLYAPGTRLPHKGLLEDIKTLSGEDWEKIDALQKTDGNLFKTMDFFELDLFENDKDILILKLKSGSGLYKALQVIHKGLKLKYDVETTFSDYNPHITLAYLKQGEGRKYLNSEALNAVLRDSRIDFEDFLISYGAEGEIVDRKQHYLTQYKNIERFFRLFRMRTDEIF